MQENIEHPVFGFACGQTAVLPRERAPSILKAGAGLTHLPPNSHNPSGKRSERTCFQQSLPRFALCCLLLCFSSNFGLSTVPNETLCCNYFYLLYISILVEKRICWCCITMCWSESVFVKEWEGKKLFFLLPLIYTPERKEKKKFPSGMESVQKPPRGGHLDVGASWDDFYGRQTNIFSPFVYDVRFNERCDRIQPSVQLIQTCEGRLHTYSIANLYSSGFFLGNERENQREKGGVRFSMSASGGCIQTRERKNFFSSISNVCMLFRPEVKPSQ